MTKTDEPPPARAGWRIIRQWRTGSLWHAAQEDYTAKKEAWAAYRTAGDAMRGVDAQVDLYDLARGAVLATARAGPVIDADKVLTKAEITAQLNALFRRPEPSTRTDEGETA